MNLKAITISSLLACTAYAATKDAAKDAAPATKPVQTPIEGIDKLTAAISSMYKNEKGEVTLNFSKLGTEDAKALKKLHHDLEFSKFINDKGHKDEVTNPASAAEKDYKFCAVTDCPETDTMIKELRLKEAPSKASFDLFARIIDPKIAFVMDHLSELPLGSVEKIKKDLNIEDNSKLAKYIAAEFAAFKAYLRSYEPKPKNFKGLRSMMEALEVVTRFESKAVYTLDLILSKLGKNADELILADAEHTAKRSKLLQQYVLYGRASDGEKAKAKEQLDAAYNEYMEALDNLAKKSLIARSLKKAHEKTSSPVTLAWFLGVFVLVAMGMLVMKQIQLKKLKEEGEDEDETH